MNYKDSGVDIDAGNAFVSRLKEKVPGIGGFSGTYPIPKGYDQPVLVSATDGVGTKINMCRIFNDYTTIGIDLVAMCVNDVITCGADPLYFLDYICTSDIKLYGDLVKELVNGIVEGCKQSGCSLLGGETAEHPRRSSMVDPIRDMAGFCTGIVEQSQIIDGSLIRESDLVIGIESSGLHSNGYSLIRDMLWRHKIFLNGGYEEAWDGSKVEDPSPTPELLIPTTIYAPVVSHLLTEFPILGMANITGGGIPENLPRCIPDGLEARVDYNSWPMPKIFSKIMLAGEIPEEEMKNVFNLGIGYCVVVPANVATDVQSRIHGHGLQSWVIGDIISK